MSMANISCVYRACRAVLWKNLSAWGCSPTVAPQEGAEASVCHRSRLVCRYALGVATALIVYLAVPRNAGALTMEQLRTDALLTPERFVHYFADFKFELGEVVRKPEVFLARRAGDCDDFATLAASVLRDKGYSTRLVVVFMQRDIHVVCYVSQVKAFLDYNLRTCQAPLVASDGSLKDIAKKVAGSFGEDWYSVSEFTYIDGVRRFVLTDFN